ncbi:PREDICTED: neprilysin-1-like [Ceratosolen solmsi marchali]|uniref:Neprilysin-1-like n=1 Tax=Ceratosolen solmsi marchali TaxID=326594 RepID=A0AAJ6YD66_9HYME|nr:PREDICTED: neprilysin-1-like [Ceratosolen solmsi marchali]
MSLREVEVKYPGIDWLDYSNTLLAPHSRVELDELVNVVVPSFLEEFIQLIKKTPKRVLANYVFWRVASSSASFLGKRVQDIALELEAALTGMSKREPRWKECISEASESLFIAAGALYVRRDFNESFKASTIDIIRNIRKSFKSIVMQASWIDKKTKTSALEKLDWIVQHIAYPSEFLDNDKLDEFYKLLKIYPESYFKSQLSLNLFNAAYVFEKFNDPVNKTNWISHGRSAIVNAFYDPTENSIQFPVGILQGHLFAQDRPKYLNYGAIGYIMGHEITHGFDDEGRQFDKNGNLFEWWEPETKEKYLQRAQCIVDQYSNYTVKEINLKLLL